MRQGQREHPLQEGVELVELLSGLAVGRIGGGHARVLPANGSIRLHPVPVGRHCKRKGGLEKIRSCAERPRGDVTQPALLARIPLGDSWPTATSSNSPSTSGQPSSKGQKRITSPMCAA